MSSTRPLHFLLLVVSLPVVVAMSEPISPDIWEPPPFPPTPPHPPMDDPNVTDPLTGDLGAYCQMLLQSPVPTHQIPWFCLCTHCQSNQGPKGDRGDRGLPGNTTLTGCKSPLQGGDDDPHTDSNHRPEQVMLKSLTGSQRWF